jgi:hypothetical protein
MAGGGSCGALSLAARESCVMKHEQLTFSSKNGLDWFMLYALTPLEAIMRRSQAFRKSVCARGETSVGLLAVRGQTLHTLSVLALFGALVTWAPSACGEQADDSVFITIVTGTDNDTLIEGLTNQIRVGIDSGNDTVLQVDLVFLWTFSTSNYIGPLFDTGSAANILHSSKAKQEFTFSSWNPALGITVSNPDTTHASYQSLGAPPYWQGAGELHRIVVVPSDTGEFTIEDTFAQGTPIRSEVVLYSTEAATLVWDTSHIVSVGCSEAIALAGDVNYDRRQSASDIIPLVNYVFKSGGAPVILELGDLNCSAVITSADVIELIGVVFKGHSVACSPCD